MHKKLSQCARMLARKVSRDREWAPALGRLGGAGAYDQVVRRLSLDKVHELLLRQIVFEPGCRMLDLGCGSGLLGSLLRRSHPETLMVGVDRDKRMLVRAAGRWAQGEASGVLSLAQRLPFTDKTFDIVTATLLLHHLTHTQKIQALREAKRVLRAGGWLHVADWTSPRRGVPAVGFLLVRLVDGFGRTADHAAGRLVAVMKEAGFVCLETLQPVHTRLGTLGFYRARNGK